MGFEGKFTTVWCQKRLGHVAVASELKNQSNLRRRCSPLSCNDLLANRWASSAWITGLSVFGAFSPVCSETFENRLYRVFLNSRGFPRLSLQRLLCRLWGI